MFVPSTETKRSPGRIPASCAALCGKTDVTTGGTTVSFRQGGALHTVPGFRALRGYDLASGLGTVNALLFVRELAGVTQHAARHAPAPAPTMPSRFPGALLGRH